MITASSNKSQSQSHIDNNKINENIEIILNNKINENNKLIDQTTNERVTVQSTYDDDKCTVPQSPDRFELDEYEYSNDFPDLTSEEGSPKIIEKALQTVQSNVQLLTKVQSTNNGASITPISSSASTFTQNKNISKNINNSWELLMGDVADDLQLCLETGKKISRLIVFHSF